MIKGYALEHEKTVLQFNNKEELISKLDSLSRLAHNYQMLGLDEIITNKHLISIVLPTGKEVRKVIENYMTKETTFILFGKQYIKDIVITINED